MTRRVLVPPLLLFQLGQPFPSVPVDPAVLVDAERAFARDAAERGTRAAFLAHMGEGSVVFEPEPVDARATWEARAAGPGLLSWEPAHAAIAASGDLGFTTGPWEFRPAGPEDEPVAFGEYATVWRKGSDATWRWVADIGIGHGPHAAPPGAPVLAAVGPTPATPATAADVRDAERGFAAAAAGGLEAAYLAHAAPDVLLLRDGSERAVGLAVAAPLGARLPLEWEPAEAIVSRAGDLGVVYGSARVPGRTGSAGWLRVWRRGTEGWRILLDVATLPPEGS